VPADQQAIRGVLDELVRERRRLERDHAADVVLEANRLAITYWQERLTGSAEKSGYTGRRSRM
jgi:hypothetical protein